MCGQAKKSSFTDSFNTCTGEVIKMILKNTCRDDVIRNFDDLESKNFKCLKCLALLLHQYKKIVAWLTAGDIAIGSDECNRTVMRTHTPGRKWNGIRVFSSGVVDPKYFTNSNRDFCGILGIVINLTFVLYVGSS